MWRTLPLYASKMWIKQGQQSQQCAANRRFGPFGENTPSLESLFNAIKDAHECGANQRGQDAQQRIKSEFPQAPYTIFDWQREGGKIAIDGASNNACYHSGNHDGAKVANAKRAQNDFQRKYHAGDWRVKRSCDATCCAASYQISDPVI